MAQYEVKWSTFVGNTFYIIFKYNKKNKNERNVLVSIRVSTLAHVRVINKYKNCLFIYFFTNILTRLKKTVLEFGPST